MKKTILSASLVVLTAIFSYISCFAEPTPIEVPGNNAIIENTPARPIGDIVQQGNLVNNTIEIQNSINEYIDNLGNRVVEITAGSGTVTFNQTINADVFRITASDTSLITFNSFNIAPLETLKFVGSVKGDDVIRFQNTSINVQTNMNSSVLIPAGTFTIPGQSTNRFPRSGAVIGCSGTKIISIPTVKRAAPADGANWVERLMVLKRARDNSDEMKGHFDKEEE